MVVDYYAMQVHVFLMDPDAGTLEYRQSFDTYNKEGTDFVGLSLVNIVLSPDGRTAVAVGPATSGDSDPEDFTSSGSPWIYRVNAPGRVAFKGKVELPKVARGAQSGAFSRDGSKFYMGVVEYRRTPKKIKSYKIPNYPPNYVIYVFRVTPEGNLIDTGARVQLATPRPTSQLFGVDTMEVDPENRYLFVSNPSVSSFDPPFPVRLISVVDLQTLKEVKELSTVEPGDIPSPSAVIASPNEADAHFPAGITFPETISDLSVTATSDKEGELSVGDTAVFTVKVKNRGYGHAFGITPKG